MNCSSCGKKIAKSSKFCPNCGTKIEEKKVIEQPIEEVVEKVTEENKNIQENIEKENSNNNTQSVSELKKPTGAFVASIIVTVLSLFSFNILALIFGVIAIVYLCIYKEEVSNELKNRKINNGKVFNIISWVLYGIGMIIRVICIVFIAMPIMYFIDNYEYNENSDFNYDEEYYYEEDIYYDEEDIYNEDVYYDDNNYYDSYLYSNLTEINYNQFISLYNGSTESIVVIVQTNCSYCNMYKPILDMIAYNNNIDIYYLDIVKMTSDEYNSMLSSIDFFTTNTYWGTPTTLIVKNSSTVDYLAGYSDEQTTLNFYRKNSIIK